MAERITTTQTCQTPRWYGHDEGHFWRPAPFKVVWCPGDLGAAIPCGVVQPGTWAVACERDDDGHEEHRAAGMGGYAWWQQPSADGFVIHHSRQHEGWREGAARPELVLV